MKARLKTNGEIVEVEDLYDDGTAYENQHNAIINVIKIKFGSAQRQNRQV